MAREHYIIFGAMDKPDKCITIMKRWHGLDGWAARIEMWNAVNGADDDGFCNHGERRKV